MMDLRPVAVVPDPGYPGWEPLEPVTASMGRRAVATASVTLALCFGGCGVEGGNERSTHDATQLVVPRESDPPDASKTLPEPRMAGTGTDVGRTMDGSTMGLPLALGLSAEERAPRRFDGVGLPPSSPATSTPSSPVLLALSDKPKEDDHIQENDVVQPIRPKVRKFRMSGCSRMAGRGRR
jgi:hypothetical protein